MRSLRDYHPLVSLLYFIFVLTLSMMTRNPIWVTLCFVFSGFYVMLLHGVKRLLKSLLTFVPMLALIVFINSYFNSLGLTVLFYLGEGKPITIENLSYGVFSGLALFTVFLWFTSYNSMLSSDEILAVFGKRLPTIGLSLSMILKYIPDTIEQGTEISLNQKAMLGQEKLSNSQKAKFAARMLTVLLSWSMENSLETADSMLAKGYPSKNRISYSRNRFNKRDLTMIILFLVIFSLHLSFAFGGAVKFSYYPFLKWQGLEGNSFILFSAIISLIVMLLLPILLDMYNWFSWRKIFKQEKASENQIKTGIIIYE
ncbi:MAG: energy-coupling factor transporter transmembrane component T [Bacillota bacterium]|jgi:energy-coupling factor transport system permease protein|nr:energy-coupling factor transporter transmembrane component T [Bacillota bacterium]